MFYERFSPNFSSLNPYKAGHLRTPTGVLEQNFEVSQACNRLVI
jgi:hypothetical protein